MRETTWLKGTVLLAYILVIIMNVVANTLPLFGRTTGAISNQFDALFTPAGITFSIWGLIYLLLGFFVVRFMTYDGSIDRVLFRKTAIWFCVSCVFNIAWLFAWHAVFIVWAMAALFFLTHAIGRLVVLIHESYANGSGFEKTTFTLYLGWVSVATIANVTIWLVSLDLTDPFGRASVIGTAAILLVGAVMAILVNHYLGSLVYGLVFIWAYAGILLKQFERAIPVPWLLVASAVISMALIIGVSLLLRFRKRQTT
ncbi:MAG: tryptophan-rich sensory protein [Acholeplasmatales bacterium]|nr:MAG: tryptophan-rich sensory protein [Acholeplasmatales bacterium]